MGFSETGLRVSEKLSNFQQRGGTFSKGGGVGEAKHKEGGGRGLSRVGLRGGGGGAEGTPSPPALP